MWRVTVTPNDFTEYKSLRHSGSRERHFHARQNYVKYFRKKKQAQEYMHKCSGLCVLKEVK